MAYVCPGYKPAPSFQLQVGGVTGPVDCQAHAATIVLDGSTCGAKRVPGRTIRLRSNEPIPDAHSPGLNLNQIANVLDDYGLYLDVRIGWRALTWPQYERFRSEGHFMIIDIGYAPIADSKYDAGRGFRDAHALAEGSATWDSLADGRASNVWRYNGALYTRSVVQRAAERLWTGSSYTGRDRVWCAIGRDVVPEYRAVVHPVSTRYFEYIVNESTKGIVTRTYEHTKGFSGECTAPRSYYYPSVDKTYRLVKMLTGANAGDWISAQYAMEVDA